MKQASRPAIGLQQGRGTAILDHQLFAVLVAPAGLGGAGLAAAKALAQWAVLLAPMAATGVWIFGLEKDRAASVAASAAAALALAMAFYLSMVVVVPRPFMDAGATNYLDHVRDSAFPSDHATLAFTFSFVFWLRRPPKVPLIYLPLLVLALLVSWARVFLGAHYPSDIAGAALVAALAAVATAAAPGRYVLRLLDTLSESARSGVIAGWRRIARRFHRPGASGP